MSRSSPRPSAVPARAVVVLLLLSALAAHAYAASSQRFSFPSGWVPQWLRDALGVSNDYDPKKLQAVFPETAKQQAGYYLVNGTHGGHLFYWMFESRGDVAQDPVVVWLTGGPGCSSELALLSENGPLNLKPDGKLERNPYSWNEAATVVYVDQPVGTGFSYVERPTAYVRNEQQVADDFYTFLQLFFADRPQLADRPLYITGESYAGHYVPAIAHRVLEGAQRGEGAVKLRLSGIAIGNGWVNPRLQYPAYAEFAYENGIIGKAGYGAARAAYRVCQKLIDGGLWPVALEQCQATTMAIVAGGHNFNVYDIRKKCESFPTCYDFSYMDAFMGRADLHEALGVGGRPWRACDMAVHTMLLGDWVKGFEGRVAALLDAGIPALVYNGDKDFICNHVGGLAWTSAMEWSGRAAFNAAPMANWTVAGRPAGAAKSANGLTFLRVADAGHMVPMDQPRPALALLRALLRGSFDLEVDA
eukprot:tig00001657_g9542.t1